MLWQESSSVSGNERRSRVRPPTSDAGWNRLATWYDGWVGAGGSHYHRALAIPAALELLEPAAGEDVLEIGAGQGVLADHVARARARYTGIDASPRLIDIARRRHGRAGRFLVGDARRLPAMPGLGPASFDAAVFLLSIQDMDPLDAIFGGLGWALRPTGRVVIVMTHPAFRQPRHAGWGFDEGRKLVFRRVDAYLSPMAVPMKQLGTGPPTRSYHRPLSSYVNSLSAAGFAIDAMREIPDSLDERRPVARRAGARAAAEIPLFLALRARRWNDRGTVGPA
jgi:SAM-dependent methyltransferase